MDAISATVAIERSWAEAPADESPSALHAAFDRVAEALYRFLYVRVGSDAALAEDLLQQVCCAAAESRSAPRDTDECGAWLFGVARNLLRRHHRKLKRQGVRIPLEDGLLAERLGEVMSTCTLPQQAIAAREHVDQLLLAITSLDVADQALIFAFYFDGRSSGEIAESKGVSIKSIESKLYRVRARLRAKLDAAERTET